MEGRADAIGLCRRKERDCIYLIEAKASRGDLLSRKQKAVYAQSLEAPASDFYYFILADGVAISDSDYPAWGVIDERGKVTRRATKMNPDHSRQAGWRNKDISRLIAHTLVYRVYGKLYGTNPTLDEPASADQ